MEDKKIGDVNVKAKEGFSINLYTNGGIPYIWGITNIPDFVAFVDKTTTVLDPKPGGRVKITFNFLALEKGQDYLEFKLIQPFGDFEIAEEVSYALIVDSADLKRAKNEMARLNSAMGESKFLKITPEAMSTLVNEKNIQAYKDPETGGIIVVYGAPTPPEPVPDYGVPCALPVTDYGIPIMYYGAPCRSFSKKDFSDQAISQNNICIPPYGFSRQFYDPTVAYGVNCAPALKGSNQGTQMLYAAPMVLESQENCLLKYGTPWGISKNSEECILKYGVPLFDCENAENEDCIVKYGFPVRIEKASEDSERCVVKYGTPSGIAKNANECNLKYGFPVGFIEHPNCIVKYGFPGGNSK
ncbi:protease inhibitor I42 family protein [Methanococcus maripaludis]|uniref:Proteinase inhibitor I42 chagasin domain-containing protein n=1 Tax=Methanococcus maripaludis TaxID=39152 RepID=A0A8T4H4J8_METMI|nr:protease inhibitor I42 family protein [Methanococcus maripaludis]MBM7408471.1 hypothetical protein [Methanococcus maripaludis]MBP2220221.1 hypothetical protein [Methanococcus maripaludis]